MARIFSSPTRRRRRQDHHHRQPAAGLARLGQRVLVVDLDPQGNATMGSGVDKRALVAVGLRRAAGSRRQRGRSPPAQRRPATTCSGPTASWPAPRSSWSNWSAASAPEAGGAGRRRRRIRLRAGRLPALAQPADAQRPVRRPWRGGAHAVRIFRARRPVRPVNTIKQVHANLNRICRSSACCVMFDPRITLAAGQRAVQGALRRQGFDTVIPRNVRRPRRPATACRRGVRPGLARRFQAFIEFAGEMVRRIESMR